MHLQSLPAAMSGKRTMRILILGVKRPYPPVMAARCKTLGATKPSPLNNGERLYHVEAYADNLGESSRLFHELYQREARDKSLADYSHKALAHFMYDQDPACIIPRECDGVCQQYCHDDIWATARYQRLVNPSPGLYRKVIGDCDDGTLLGAPFIGGTALFCLGWDPSKPMPPGAQAHVLTRQTPTRAIDISVRGGMPPFSGRDCFWYDDSGVAVAGILRGPMRDEKGSMSIFAIERK